MSTLDKRITELEYTAKLDAIDVWDIIKGNGFERGLEILEQLKVAPSVIAEIYAAREKARADVREWERATFGDDDTGEGSQ